MFLRQILALPFIFLALPAASSQADALLDALGIPEVIAVMQDEGVAYGAELAEDLIPGGPSPSWNTTVQRIYSVKKMEASVREGFREALADTDLDPLLAFFRTEQGQRIVRLEISARQALVDEDVEEQARAVFRDLDGSGDDRLRVLDEFVEVNDLIEANVVGALNSSYQFYRGLAEGGAVKMSEDEIVSDVWAQEEDTRVDTREWLYGYLLMAYGPLEPEIIEDYTALSRTEAGAAMNRALFAGFDDMYGDISYALGLAAARQMQSQDL
ncbi:DUF2059 domain-containing protein [Primorskyibacter marinus]|uniref:DUF2059 domain-containing protein n=1 Tax=Primorskyibacter marinus TaxID=1977320 RepID=UPI000E301EF4|nr:DUF2059 domain-containing protein [Primorskyibacter marinus]